MGTSARQRIGPQDHDQPGSHRAVRPGREAAVYRDGLASRVSVHWCDSRCARSGAPCPAAIAARSGGAEAGGERAARGHDRTHRAAREAARGVAERRERQSLGVLDCGRCRSRQDDAGRAIHQRAARRSRHPRSVCRAIRRGRTVSARARSTQRVVSQSARSRGSHARVRADVARAAAVADVRCRARDAVSRTVRCEPGAQGSRDRGADGTVHRCSIRSCC